MTWWRSPHPNGKWHRFSHAEGSRNHPVLVAECGAGIGTGVGVAIPSLDGDPPSDETCKRCLALAMKP